MISIGYQVLTTIVVQLYGHKNVVVCRPTVFLLRQSFTAQQLGLVSLETSQCFTCRYLLSERVSKNSGYPRLMSLTFTIEPTSYPHQLSLTTTLN